MITKEQVKAKTIERFWSKINFGEANECWEWQASLRGGYGLFSTSYKGAGISHIAHRFLFIQLFGELPRNTHVLHRCDNRKCVNPNHFFTGTNYDNVQDKVSKGRHSNAIFPGGKNPSAKLRSEDVVAIKERLKNGETQLAVGKSYGVCQSQIWRIAHGTRWKNITL